MDRAYSLLHIKSVDEDQRIIEGLASSPETDRTGDILESSGAQFSLPIPLLWQHRTDQPIGQVLAATVTKSGIQIRAQIARNLLPRIEEAWTLIKSGLVRGLSVGFRSIEDEPIKGTFGVHFLKWEWLELSAVTVPANASSSIASIKSFDVDRPAATGTAERRLVIPIPAPRDVSRTRSMTNAERLTTKKADLRTKSARLDDLMTKADNEVLSDADRQEQTTLNGEVQTLTADVESLERIEKAQMLNARPVVAINTESGARSRDVEHVVEVKSVLPPGVEFARAIKCKMAQVVHGGSALDYAKGWYPDYPRIQAYLKAAVNPMTSADGANTGGTNLVYATNLVSEFIEFLRPMTIIGKFGANGVPSLRRIPFNVRITGQSSGGAGYWVGQSKLKPVKKFDISATTLTFAKVAAITVQSDELARFSQPSSEALIRDALAEALVERLDTDFVDPFKQAVTNVSPAGITQGLVALTPSGTDAVAVRADIKQLLAPFIAANISPTTGVFITTNTVALTLSLMRNALGQKEFPDVTMLGGRLEGFPVIASQYCSAGSPETDMLIFCNASDIFLADDGQASVDISREASIEMSDDPENEAGTVTSMFQSNSIALRAERYINWAKRRAAAVAYLDGVAYDSGSPA